MAPNQRDSGARWTRRLRKCGQGLTHKKTSRESDSVHQRMRLLPTMRKGTHAQHKRALRDSGSRGASDKTVDIFTCRQKRQKRKKMDLRFSPKFANQTTPNSGRLSIQLRVRPRISFEYLRERVSYNTSRVLGEWITGNGEKTVTEDVGPTCSRISGSLRVISLSRSWSRCIHMPQQFLSKDARKIHTQKRIFIESQSPRNQVYCSK